MSAKLTDILVLGQPVEVTVDNEGIFRAKHGGQSFNAHSLEGLTDQLNDAIRKTKVKIAVEFTDSDGTHCVITGRHATTGAYLGKREGVAETWRSLPWEVMRPLSDEDKAEFERLRQAARAAAKELRLFIDKRRLHSLQAVVNEALAKAKREEAEKAQ